MKKGTGSLKLIIAALAIIIFFLIFSSLLVLRHSDEENNALVTNNKYTAQATSSPSPSESPSPSPSPSPTPMELLLIQTSPGVLAYNPDFPSESILKVPIDSVFTSLAISIQGPDIQEDLVSKQDPQGFTGMQDNNEYQTISFLIPSGLTIGSTYTVTARGVMNGLSFIDTVSFSLAASEKEEIIIKGTGDPRPTPTPGGVIIYPPVDYDLPVSAGCRAHMLKAFSLKDDLDKSLGVIAPNGNQIKVRDIVDAVNENCELIEKERTRETIVKKTGTCLSGYLLDKGFLIAGVIEAVDPETAKLCIEGQEIQGTITTKENGQEKYSCMVSYSQLSTRSTSKIGKCYEAENDDPLNRCICCKEKERSTENCLESGSIVRACCPSDHTPSYACDGYHKPFKAMRPCASTSQGALRMLRFQGKSYTLLPDSPSNMWYLVWWTDSPGIQRCNSEGETIDVYEVDIFKDDVKFDARFHSYLSSCLLGDPGFEFDEEAPCKPDMHKCFDMNIVYYHPNNRDPPVGPPLPPLIASFNDKGIRCVGIPEAD